MPGFICSLLLGFLASFFQPENAVPWHLRGYTQGTTYRITYYAGDSLVSKKQVEHLLSGIDSSLSIYKPYSVISRFNSSRRGLEADKHLKKVVGKALEVSAETGGAFDVTVYPLVQAWGFGTRKVAVLPGPDTIRALLPCIGGQKIHFGGNRLIKSAPCVKIDVNGIAQGYTVDVIARFLEENNISDYLVEIGGEIRVKGRKAPEGQVMTIGIEGPATSAGDDPYLQKVIRLEKGAVTTSGNYRRYVQSGNKKLSHLIDPKTGYPIQNELLSVTVVADDAMTADVYDNSLMGMGLPKALAFMKTHPGLEAYFVFKKTDGSVSDTATTGFYKLLETN